MEETENLSITFSGSSIAKNTIYNLLGNIIPLIFALVFIPPLIKGLGTERFGILSIAWMIVGYFSFFDFGLGRGLTKIIAEKIGLNQTDQIPKIFWTSLFLMISISLIAVIGLLFFVPSLVNIFKISQNLQHETTNIFYMLALSIPVVTTMTGLRGLLEAYQKFATINIMKVFLGIFTFLGPLLVLIITNSLFWIIAFLIFTRIIIWILYLLQCLKVARGIRNEIRVDLNSIKPVLKFSIWITVGNIIVPIIFYSDRFLIGALISVTAITYYVTPFEVVTKLMMISVALSGVLFPIFSASFFNNPNITKKIFLRGVKFIFLTMYPFVLLIITFSYEGIELWIGKDFAVNSSLIMQLLAIGILMNSMSLIPNIFFQGIGKPRIPTLINLVELPVYILMMWFSIKFNGINGAAMAFTIMATIDAIGMYIVAHRMFAIRFESKFSLIMFLLMLSVLIVPFLLSNIIFKIILVVISLSVFILIAWNRFLSVDEKYFIVSKLKFNLNNQSSQ
ncbi:MAG: flippase [Candidatus Lokiarchaeota archaeon]|nr:flippase [Candidatus Lokiarchaeota archaeon]